MEMNIMHYDESLFPNAKSFKPERFLGPASDINRNAYRPFERGLRACPGQALAINEMRVAVLMT
ncbi:cytochrome P450, partial [Candidatus Bathyarchaeota archaeon]|nr:cytochrome P450 [Candidatus Bathyarchaeota archaeon]